MECKRSGKDAAIAFPRQLPDSIFLWTVSPLLPYLLSSPYPNNQINIAAIREYRSTDKEAIIGLIKLNTPAYFAKDEEVGLEECLDNKRELYYVVCWEDQIIIGCAGSILPIIKQLGELLRYPRRLSKPVRRIAIAPTQDQRIPIYRLYTKNHCQNVTISLQIL